MTNAEYEKLVSTYGKDVSDQCITVLDNYKGANGKKYKIFYLFLLSYAPDCLQNKSPISETPGLNLRQNLSTSSNLGL